MENLCLQESKGGLKNELERIEKDQEDKGEQDRL